MAAITAAVIAAGGAAYSIIQGANAKAEAEQAAGKAAQSLAQMQEADKFANLQVPTRTYVNWDNYCTHCDYSNRKCDWHRTNKW